MPEAAMKLDLGTYIEPKLGDINVTGTAGGAGDGTEADGSFVSPNGAFGAVMLITWEAVLADTETLAFTANARDATSAAGAGVADFKATAIQGADGAGKQTLTSVVVVTSVGGTTESGVTKVRFPDIRSHRGFLQSQVTGFLSAGATDTFEYTVTWVFSGIESTPAPATLVNP